VVGCIVGSSAEVPGERQPVVRGNGSDDDSNYKYFFFLSLAP